MSYERFDLPTLQQIDRDLDAKAGPGHPASALRPGTLSPGGTACTGEDGHLFIGNGANAWERQYRGEFPATAEWRDGWARLFDQRRTQAAAHGAHLAQLVCPEKQAVIPHKRWGAAPPDGAGRPVRRLLEMGDDLLYPADALAALQETTPAVFRHNSHWTASGCLAAVDIVLQALKVPLACADLRFAGRTHHGQQDLTAHFFRPPPQEDMLLLVENGRIVGDNQQLQKTGRHTGASYAVHNEAAPDPRGLVVFGDSYAYDAGLTYALSAVFAKVLFVWSKDIDWTLVAEARAELVLWESAERFLVTAPAS